MWSPSWIIIASPPSKAKGLGEINETKKKRNVAFQQKNATKSINMSKSII